MTMRCINNVIQLLLITLFWPQSVLTQSPPNCSAGLANIFHDVKSLSVPRSGNPWLGYQNLTYCCILALEHYLDNSCKNDPDVQIDPQILNNSRQFPCGAAYIGDFNGAPLVEVSYNWASQHCPGWQISETTNLTQWLQVLVGFLLPSVIFSLNIPRRKKFLVADKLFEPKLRDVLLLPYALLAIVIAAWDTVVWLCVVFAMAAPLLFSGVHEAWLDLKVVDHLQAHRKEWAMQQPLAVHARLLFAILAGNLDLYPAWKHTMSLARDLDELDYATAHIESASSVGLGSPYEGLDETSPWQQDTSIVSGRADYSGNFLSPDTARHLARATLPTSADRSSQAAFNGLATHNHQISPGSISPTDQSSRTESEALEEPDRFRQPIKVGEVRLRKLRPAAQVKRGEERNTWETVGKIDMRLSTRLQSMLACQYSFGSTIGAPVLFYAGSFTYAIIEIKQLYGDNDVAIALAFGCWWMVIPHIATIGGLLLGGNNPNTLTVIIGAKEPGKLKYIIGATKPNYEPPNMAQNPNIEEDASDQAEQTDPGVQFEGDRRRKRRKVKKQKPKFLEDVYESVYKPASMWNRGKSKQEWLLVLCADSWSSYQGNKQVNTYVKDMVLRLIGEVIVFNSVDWILLVSLTFGLLFIPCLLGWLTAYWTPQVGLSCRSLTFTIYLGVQGILLCLWSLETTWFDEYWRLGREIKHLDNLDHEDSHKIDEVFQRLQSIAARDTRKPPGLPKPKDLFDRLRHFVFNRPGKGTRRASVGGGAGGLRDEESNRAGSGTHAKIGHLQTLWLSTVKVAYYFTCLLVLVIAVFTAIGGTLLQIIGVYRSCYCKINVGEWLPGRQATAMLILSTNDHQSIQAARRHWSVIGSVSVGFLVVVAYVGWWYQKGVRARFKQIASDLGDDIQERKKKIPFTET